MENLKKVRQIEKELEKIYGDKTSTFERLIVAAQINQTNIIASGLVVSSTDSYPSALEKIAMEMGTIKS